MKTIFLLIGLLISGEEYTKLIPNITNPEQVIWEDVGHIIFVKDENIFEYDILKDWMNKVGERKLNEFVGTGEDGNLVLCEIRHFVISSKDEFSTVFKVNDKELKFFPTIQPISLRGDIIVAKTALDFLEQHYYEIHLSDGSIKEVPKSGHPRSFLYVSQDLDGNIFINFNARDYIKYIYTIYLF